MARPRRENPWDHWRPHGGGKAPELIPVFGVKAFSAASTCGDIHPGGPIPSGSRCVCMGPCHRSGVDHFPAVRGHTKAGDGTIRDEWASSSGPVAAEPTRYAPSDTTTSGKAALRGGMGR